MKAVGIILAGGNSKRMKQLVSRRASSAMPIAGSFRAIDFALSNMSNSHIQKVGVITQYNSVSLNEHLNSSKWWDFGRKQGGLFLCTPTITSQNSDWYRGTADALYQNMDFLLRTHEPYVIIASGDGVYKLDYNKVLEYHIEKRADITIVTKTLDTDEDVSRFGVVTVDQDGRLMELEEKPVESAARTVSTGIYVLRRRLLIELLEKSAMEDGYDFVSDILVKYRKHKRIFAFEMPGYWRNISSVDAYYKTNMDFLNRDTREYFFNKAPEIYSKVDDNPPAKYNPGSRVVNSLVSSGSIVNGTIENSLIFKEVYVGNGCVIKNSIILNDVYIGDNTTIENCIVESRGTLKSNTHYFGSPEDIKIVVEEGERFSL